MLSPFKTKNRLNMQNLTPTEICNKLIKLSGIDLFKNTRKRPYVEVRALACFLMYSGVLSVINLVSYGLFAPNLS